jgi:hypothetical protein
MTLSATGVTDLFAALNAATGEVIATIRRRHRADEFKKFLAEIDKAVPTDLVVHVVLDNSSTHKTPAIKTWLLRHPRFPLPLHADELLVAEPGRAMVRRIDAPAPPAVGPPQRQDARSRPARVDGHLERESPPIRVAEDR